MMSFYLTSCYDNSVVNNEQPFSFDSARFNVTYKRAPFDLSGAYVTDTDKILLYDYDGYAFYKNGAFIFSPYNLNFYPTSNMDGFDESNVYLGGFEKVYENRVRYKLLKWNGSDFDNIQMADTVSGIHHEFASVFCKSPNEIWLGTRNGTAWKYDGLNFAKYIIDTNYGSSTEQQIITYLLNDGNDNLCCALVRDSSNDIGTSGNRYFNFYILNTNEEFKLKTAIKYNNNFGPAFLNKVGNRMYTVTRDGLFEFDDHSFLKITDIGPIKNPWNNVVGTGPYDLMISGRIETSFGYSVCSFHWNGKKWSEENKFLSYSSSTIYTAYLNNMFICADYTPNNYTLIKFFRKN
jgi:hypothetical protein